MGLTTQTYDILTRLAIGNGSLVYRAVHKTSLRQVAIKLLGQDPDFNHRFDVATLLSAASQIRLITGSHVCQLLEAFEDEDGLVLVYEFADGMSGSEIPFQRKLNPTQSLDVAAQLISALRSGERQRTPHGDIKPSNVVFVELADGRPFTLVLDWGLAAFRTESPKDSLPYLAPERLKGEGLSHQADLFSAGATLFYLLTGKVLAGGNNHAELAAGWARARPEMLGELRPDLPPKLVQWIGSLLALDARRRPASAVEASASLAALHPPPPVAAPETIRPHPPTASQRPPGITGSGIVPPASGIATRPVASGVRRPPVAAVGSAVASAVKAAGKPLPAAPAKRKSNVLVLSLVFALATGAAGVGAWWLTRAKADSLAQYEAGNSRPASARPASRPALQMQGGINQPQDGRAAAKPGVVNRSVIPVVLGKAAPSASALPAKAPAPAGGPALSTLVISEPFAYPPGGQIDNAAAGTGWAAPWKGGSARLENLSLPFPAHPETGGSLTIPASDQSVVVKRELGPLSRLVPDAVKGGHFYFAALVKHTDSSAAPGGELRLFPAGGPEDRIPCEIIVADTGAGMKISLRGSKESIELAEGTPVALLICKVSLYKPQDGKWEGSFALQVNPSLRAPQFIGASQTLTTSAEQIRLPKSGFLEVRKDAGKATSQIDEVRYGLHWTDVTFQPPRKPGAPKAPDSAQR